MRNQKYNVESNFVFTRGRGQGLVPGGAASYDPLAAKAGAVIGRRSLEVMRSLFLAGSQSRWLRERAPRYSFVRQAVSRFMPGETIDDALRAACALRELSVGSVFTCLGENVKDPEEANAVTAHYLDVLDRIRKLGLGAELSVKLTQLGLDFDRPRCEANLSRIIRHAGRDSFVWIDMESIPYVDPTLEVYRGAQSAFSNVGVCLQAYLKRTEVDIMSLLPLGPSVRLVKGAYRESPLVAIQKKRDVDENYFRLSTLLLGDEARRAGGRVAIATHDRRLIRRIIDYGVSKGLGKDSFEFQMLYGIQRDEQCRLAREGWKSIALIAYGSYWFPWYMRRLAERPANVWFVVRSLFSG